MATREGNLEAPTRHPVDWKNPLFYDQGACESEMERIFDICHGCRRCVSLCHPERDRSLRGAAAIRQQLEGDDADRVPRCA